MYWLKACPRCLGDLREEKDVHGLYVACIQCGYILIDEEEQQLRISGNLVQELLSPAREAA